MATVHSQRHFICRCKFERNIFLKGFNKHVTYQNRQQFLEDYKEMFQRNISEDERECLLAEQNLYGLLGEEQPQLFDNAKGKATLMIEKEVSRRKTIGTKSMQIKQRIQEKYQHLHPHLLVLQEDYLSAEFLKLVNLSKSRYVTKEILINEMEQEEAPLSYSFRVFNYSFCDQLLQELDNFYHSGLLWSKPNSMNNFGVLLSELGYQDHFINPLVFDYLSPIAKILYPEWVGDGIDSHRAFIVTYQIGKDVDLSYHYDDAEVTINVSLGKNYEGGELYIGGMKDEPNWSKKCFKYKHRKAYGYLHRAQQMHGAIEIEDGERFNMIIWMRSSSIRNRCCPMCNKKPDLFEVEDEGAGFTVRNVDVCCTL